MRMRVDKDYDWLRKAKKRPLVESNRWTINNYSSFFNRWVVRFAYFKLTIAPVIANE